MYKRQGFKRLGVVADWEHPYKTMSPSFEAEEVKVCLLYTSSYGIHLVSGHGKFRWQWSILKNHCLIASSTAYIIYLTGLKVPNVLASACSFLGQTTSPLIMLLSLIHIFRHQDWRAKAV